MQIVLWKPPGDFVQDVVKEVTRKSASSRGAANEECDISDDMVDFDVSKASMDQVDQPLLSSLGQYR